MEALEAQRQEEDAMAAAVAEERARLLAQAQHLRAYISPHLLVEGPKLPPIQPARLY